MRLLRTASLMLLSFWGFVLSSRVAAQTAGASHNYANFVGDWSGTKHHLDGKSYVDEAMKLRISLTKHGQALLFEYELPDRKKRSEKQFKRVFELDPEREKLTVHVGRFEDIVYDTDGLRAFAARGAGSFKATNIPLIAGVPVAYQGQYLLTSDLFIYTWQRSEPHQPFILIDHVSLHKVPTPASPENKSSLE